MLPSPLTSAGQLLLDGVVIGVRLVVASTSPIPIADIAFSVTSSDDLERENTELRAVDKRANVGSASTVGAVSDEEKFIAKCAIQGKRDFANQITTLCITVQTQITGRKNLVPLLLELYFMINVHDEKESQIRKDLVAGYKVLVECKTFF